MASVNPLKTKNFADTSKMTCLRIVQKVWIHSAKVLDSFFKIHIESNRAKNESKISKNESKTVKLCAI